VPQNKGWLFDWIETIVVALVLALIIRAFFLQVFWIPSGSMEPTLDISDRIVVNKVIYNFRPPKRFEVLVFRQVQTEAGQEKRDLIKRLIGLPGEKLKIKDGVVYISNTAHKDKSGAIQDDYIALTEKHSMNRDFANYGPVTIPQNSFFMMGDNRPASADSRYWGFLPKKNLIGQAFLRIWPLTRLSLIP
jgi:signal peptidase I